ncbi:hypothetical protein RQP46_004068 [Phenoliferia psychrophenolica]
MARITSLSPELLCYIFSFNQTEYFDHGEEPDRRTLRYAALVCKAWQGPAQRALTTNSVLLRPGVGPSREVCVKKWFDSPGRAPYAVKMLKTWYLHSQAGRPTLAEVFDECEGLEDLRIQFDYQVQTQKWDVLVHPCLAKLKHLTIGHIQTPRPPRKNAPTNLPFRLESLTFDGVGGIMSPSLIKELLTTSKGTLTSLAIRQVHSVSNHVFFGPLVESFPLIAANLRHLAFDLASLTKPLADALAGCSSLTSLKLGFGLAPGDKTRTKALAWISDALPTPATLTHLEMSGAMFTPQRPAEVMAFIKSSPLATLLAVDIHRCDRGSTSGGVVLEDCRAEMQAFLAGCEERSVQVSIGQAWWPGRHGDNDNGSEEDDDDDVDQRYEEYSDEQYEEDSDEDDEESYYSGRRWI